MTPQEESAWKNGYDAGLLFEASTSTDVVVAFLQGCREDTLRALRACSTATPDYWHWQGRAELARQVLELLGAEVPR